MSEDKEKASGYWARVRGTFWRHRRTSALSLAARGLWVSLLSWCADQRSDGSVPMHAVMMACGGRMDARAMAELEACELVTKTAEGYALRNWAKHNITRERHDKNKERAKAGMANKRATDGTVTSPVTRNRAGNKPATDAAGYQQPSEQEQEQEQSPPSGGDSRARSRAVPMAAERAVLDAFDARCERVRLAVDRECRAVRRSPPPPACAPQSPEVTTVARWLSTAGEVDVDAMVRRWANARDRKGSWAPLSWLAANPGEYAFPAPSDSVVRLTSEQEDQSVRDFIDAGTRRAGGVA